MLSKPIPNTVQVFYLEGCQHLQFEGLGHHCVQALSVKPV
jgi:hypothetical protein